MELIQHPQDTNISLKFPFSKDKSANFNKNTNTCNRGPDFQPVDLHDEVILQEEEPNDGEEINQDEC